MRSTRRLSLCHLLHGEINVGGLRWRSREEFGQGVPDIELARRRRRAHVGAGPAPSSWSAAAAPGLGGTDARGVERSLLPSMSGISGVTNFFARASAHLRLPEIVLISPLCAK